MSAQHSAVSSERAVGEHELGRGAEEVRRALALVRCVAVLVNPSVTILARTALAGVGVGAAPRALLHIVTANTAPNLTLDTNSQDGARGHARLALDRVNSRRGHLNW